MGDFGPTEGLGPPASPWRAVILDGSRDETTLADIDGNSLDPDDVSVLVIHGPLCEADAIVEYDGFVAPDQIEQRYAQCRAMAAGLNAAISTIQSAGTSTAGISDPGADQPAGYHWDEVSGRTGFEPADAHERIGRASCRERVSFLV